MTSIALDTITASIPALSLDLHVEDYSIRLDDSRAPYVEAALTCSGLSPEDLEALDPRDGLRVEITLARDLLSPPGPTQTRDLDLYLHARTYDAEDATVQLIARSDEAILIDDMLGGTSVDDSAEAHQASLRAIVDHVLDTFGAALEPGTVDADYTVTWDATNLVRNPRLATAATDWNAYTYSGGSAALARETSSPPSGFNAYARCTLTGTSTNWGIYVTEAAVPVSPNTEYRVSCWVRCSSATPKHRINVAGFSDISTSDGTGATGTPVSVGASTWTRLTLAFTTGPNTKFVRVHVGSVDSGTGLTVDVTGMILTKSHSDPGYFDGGGAIPADAHYTYAWTGSSHASSSTRTRLDTRARDVLRRDPGDKAWDFLSSLVDAAGLRLFCDEQRRWHLVDPSTYTVPGQVQISDGWNATRAVDTIDLSAADRGAPGYVETVIVKYTWKDSETAQERTAYDSAGEPHGIGRLVELNRPYPGPGAAAAILARSQGKGRVLDLEALTSLTATPGQDLVAIFPGAPTQIGTTSAVEWTSEGVMLVDSRGLVEYQPGAIALLLGAIEDLVGNIEDL